jgi:predicted phosphodiesterase
VILTLAATVLAAIASLFGIGERAPARTVVYALGDGADGSAASRRLARYVRSQRPDRFIYLGDVYERGTRAEFRTNYHSLYGRLARRTDPVLGNHEFKRRARGYYPYWRRRRGFDRERARHRAYVDATGWQIVAYSSESSAAVEAAWLRPQVARHAGTCRIAAAHRGRYAVADGEHSDSPDQEPVWAALAGRTAVNLVGHSHLYGRLEPIDGVQVIVSGAGGHELRPPGTQAHAVAAVEAGVPTATRLVLRRGRLDFSQVDATGRVYDSGTIGCNPAP